MTKVKRPSLFSLFTQKSDPVGTSAANQASNGTSDTVDQSNGNEDDQNLFQEYSYLIVCCGITKDFATVSHELRKRGFLVEACSNGSHANSNSNSANNSSHDKETVQKSQETQKSNYYDLLVSMSPKLVIKLAIHSNLPIKRFQDYSYSQKLVLLEHAINILKKTKPISAKSVWLSSDKDFVNLIHNEEDSKKQNLLNYYYGSKIAIYFGWLKYYTHELRVPALLGTVLFIHQTIVGTIDTIFMPIFCIFISLWGTYLLEFAKRRMSEMAFEWKVSGVEDEELDEELAKVYTPLSLLFTSYHSIYF